MVQVKVYRFSPDNGGSHFDTWDLDIRPGETVLDLLHRIHYDIDPTLAFRRSCRSAICGSCAMRINKRSRLACNTQAREIADRYGSILVEPMGNMPVLKDLVVDMGGFWDSVARTQPYLKPGAEVPKREYIVPKEQMDVLKLVQDCIFCGSCLSECTSREANPGFLGPAALAKAYRFVADPRDAARHDRLQLYSDPNGIWDCATCLYCNEVCPKGVLPMDAIVRMRALAVEEKLVEGKGPEHAIAFYRTVVEAGHLNEAKTALGSLGAGGLLRQAPIALRLVLRRKTPKYRKKPIKGMAEVRTIRESIRARRGAKP